MPTGTLLFSRAGESMRNFNFAGESRPRSRLLVFFSRKNSGGRYFFQGAFFQGGRRRAERAFCAGANIFLIFCRKSG
jgi:hypothetical protein